MGSAIYAFSDLVIFAKDADQPMHPVREVLLLRMRYIYREWGFDHRQLSISVLKKEDLNTVFRSLDVTRKERN